MGLIALDLHSTGNETIDELRLLGANAETITSPSRRRDYIQSALDVFPFEELADKQFSVLSRQAVARSLLHLNRAKRYEGGLMFLAYALRPNRLVSRSEGIDAVTVDFYNPQIAGTRTEDQSAIANLILQTPVLDMVVCLQVG